MAAIRFNSLPVTGPGLGPGHVGPSRPFLSHIGVSAAPPFPKLRSPHHTLGSKPELQTPYEPPSDRGESNRKIVLKQIAKIDHGVIKCMCNRSAL